MKNLMRLAFGSVLFMALTACHRDVQFSKFEYSSHGAPWEVVYALKIDFGKRILEMNKAGNTEDFVGEKCKTKIIALNPEQIAKLQCALNDAGVVDWKDRYDNFLGICDGTRWEACYVLADGKSRSIAGDNNWPDGIKILSTAIKSIGVEFIE